MEKWARQHGEIFRVRSGIVTEYFINSDKAVKAIFDKSSAASSERPRWIIANELFTNQWNVLFLNASDPRWKFLHEVAHDPDAGTDKQELWPKIGRYTYSAFAQQTFGLEIKDTSSPSIPYIHGESSTVVWPRDFANRRTETGLAEIIATFPGVYLVDMIQTLDKLPSFMKMKSQISTWSFLEAMLLYPDVQEKARQQIDAVVQDRLPEWEDLEQLPYIRSTMKEVWRWRPPVALGHPHVTTRPLWYGGRAIPQGSRLHLNAWAIGHDPARHPDPHAFRPERFLADPATSLQSANLADPAGRDHFAFGAGRRICTPASSPSPF
ncbi:hypothetical protein SLS56_002824 [Neofusicoccum ribis]|uniref:Cytochrome P450 n=1 Tax=Neofusicoccum ribis TaxID=45134 RepID=A0ABR3T3H6_9PEZI